MAAQFLNIGIAASEPEPATDGTQTDASVIRGNNKRRSEGDEEYKNKLARLDERSKPEIWAKVAEEMQVPWRAGETMHWCVDPSSRNVSSPTPGYGRPKCRGRLLPMEPTPTPTTSAPHPLSHHESLLPPHPSFGEPLLPDQTASDYGNGLAPLQPTTLLTGPHAPRAGMLPSIAELTGVPRLYHASSHPQ
ncbi:hypothetical protein C8A03DRAFT_37869 [Achaetomium macrosporum]|uniref:Myb-like domain-containing protein n=1 Tax=Achaetomium macrosporum TaxID=79813 RepID=A0AAN7C3J8_9PEZI|nr:hypothetical protein C8A03DRAFT_37869 [Achaetomium macrosporum]